MKVEMKLLKNLLVDTYSGDYSDIINVITAFLKKNTDAKIVIQKIAKNKANIIAIFGKPDLVINCHMDTVPPVGKWKHNPIKIKTTSTKVYGLGTADTKGNIFSVLSAVCQIKPKNLMLLFSVDEESRKFDSGVTEFLKSGYSKGIKYAVVCEPTLLKFVNKHKGYYSYIITVKSTPYHSSKKQENSNSTMNSITKAAALILNLDKAGFNIGKISGGVRGNIIAGNCEFKISIRSYKSPKFINKKINSVVNGISGVKIKPCSIGLPLCTTKAKFPFSASQLHEAEFWTEASLFEYAGINAVVFGAGNIEQAHSSNEFVKKKELEKAQKMFEKIIGGLK